MSNGNGIPAQTGFTRVFLQKFGARADREEKYHSCMRFGAIEEALGDTTPIKCPHPTQPDKFITVGRIKSAREDPTTQLVGHYPVDIASLLKEFADLECAFDAYMPIGLCEDLSVFDGELKTVVFDESIMTNYATDEAGTLSDEGRAEVNETADIAMTRWYEVLGLEYALRAGDIVTNEVIDVVICDSPGCGDCDDPTDGCEKIFALTLSAGGSPSTPADIVYSLDKGVTFQAVDIDTLGAAEDPSALACVGSRLVVVSNDSNSLHYALLSEFTTTPAVTWTEVATGFVVSGEPNDIWSVGNTAFVVGDGGYVYKITDVTAGVTAIDAGVAVTDNLNAVHAITENFMIAGGDSGALVKSENGSTVAAVTPRPVGAGIDINAVWVKENNEREWWLGFSNGTLMYTVDKGVTFVAQTFDGSGAGVVRDIAFATKQVGWFSHDDATPRARIFKTKNGGNSWFQQTVANTAIPNTDRFNAIAVCEFDINFLVAVGLADNGTDGVIVIGED